MTPVEKALWYIENNLPRPMSLSDIAAASDVSACHLARAFVSVTGYAPIQYLRARRLSEAARQLRQGTAKDILTLALNSGYSSHEAFSRSFTDMFGVSPRTCRQQAAQPLPLVEPVSLSNSHPVSIATPRAENTPELHIAGLETRFTAANRHTIPQLWQQLAGHFSAARPPLNPYGFGVVSHRHTDSFHYLAGVEVKRNTPLPDGTATQTLPPQRYLVFTHTGHFGTLTSVISTLWDHWLPASDYQPADAPFFSKISLQSGPDNRQHKGQLEIWIPVIR